MSASLLRDVYCLKRFEDLVEKVIVKLFALSLIHVEEGVKSELHFAICVCSKHGLESGYSKADQANYCKLLAVICGLR